MNEDTPKKLIYIADDDYSIREALKVFLENAGYEVNAFETGDLLLEEFAKKEADLVILDIMMPGSSGFLVCKELRRASIVPIFILTARDSELDCQTAFDLGSDEFFTKPCSPMTIVSRVKAVLRRIEMERGAIDNK